MNVEKVNVTLNWRAPTDLPAEPIEHVLVLRREGARFEVDEAELAFEDWGNKLPVFMTPLYDLHASEIVAWMPMPDLEHVVEAAMNRAATNTAAAPAAAQQDKV